LSALQENVSVVVSRQLVSDVAAALKTLDAITVKDISNFTLNNLQTRAISFEEQVYTFVCFEIKYYKNVTIFIRY